VGKSSVLRRLVERRFQPGYAQTVGVEFASFLMDLGSTSVNLQLWDTAGQERFNSVTSSYFRGAAGVLIVFDLTK
jgi:small GTP-binding protein